MAVVSDHIELNDDPKFKSGRDCRIHTGRDLLASSISTCFLNSCTTRTILIFSKYSNYYFFVLHRVPTSSAVSGCR